MTRNLVSKPFPHVDKGGDNLRTTSLYTSTVLLNNKHRIKSTYMLQIKTFAHESDSEVNQFLFEHHVVQQGVNIKDDRIVVLYDDSFFEDRDRTALLNMNAGAFRRQIVEKTIEYRIFKEAVSAGKGSKVVTIGQGQGMPGRQMTMDEAFDSSKKDIEALEAQLYIVEQMLTEKPIKATGAVKVFGKKKYANKD